MLRWQFDAIAHLILPQETKFEDLEPAPPKDWRPICFWAFKGEGNFCDVIRNDVRVAPYDAPATQATCQQCPYRKKVD
jgi:hypothetical protein